MPKPNLKPNLLVIFFIFLFLIIPFFVGAATLYLMPQSQTVYQNDTFIAEVHLNTEDQEINVAQIELTFPKDLLEVVDLGKGNSILTLWISEPFYSNKNGLIQFQGGVPGGFKGKGFIGKIFFKAKNTGIAKIDFSADSQVLLHDGKGTPAELSFLEGNYGVIEKPENLPIISSRSHPDQNKWYKSNTLHLHWDLIEAAFYSYLLSKDPLAEPDEIPDIPEGELIWMGDMEYPDLENGIYYFSIRQKLPGEDWSPKISFRVMIDVTPPEKFEPEIGQDPSVFEGKYFLSFYTTDKTSGIEYFEVKEGKRDFKRAKSPYLLEDQSLRNKILVKAIDKSGNEKIAEIVPPYKITWENIIILVLILVGIIVIWWIVRKIKKSKKAKSKNYF